MKEELNLYIEFFITIPKDRIIDFLKNEKELSNENLELIAEILMVNLEGKIENKIEELNRISYSGNAWKFTDIVRKMTKHIPLKGIRK